MRRVPILLALLTLCAGLLSAAVQAADETKPVPVRNDPELYYLDHSDVSPPLREMRIPLSTDKRAPREVNRANVRPVLPPSQPPAGWVEPLEAVARQAAPLPDVLAAPRLNFDGIGVGFGSYTPSAVPPDATGAVGETQYVQWVNFHLAVFDKSTGALVAGPLPGYSIWTLLGGVCADPNNINGDPMVSYDKLAGRWVLTQLARHPSPSSYYQCIAVSTTSDATGSYRLFSYRFPAYNDAPKLGVWADAYYMSFEVPAALAADSSATRVCAFDRVAMVSASDLPRPSQCFPIEDFYGNLLPADFDGAYPSQTLNGGNYYLSLWPNFLFLWYFDVDFDTPENTQFSANPIQIAVAPYVEAQPVQQPGTVQLLDPLSDRPMHRLARRIVHGSDRLVATHSVEATPGVAGVRWYEIRLLSTPIVWQQGTFAPDSTSRWLGSIAMDKAGNILLGYSASSSSLHPSVRYTGRSYVDPRNTLQSEATLVTGGGSQIGSARWGDYSTLAIDPVDGCTFWYTNQYYKTTNPLGGQESDPPEPIAANWSTRIGSFKFPNCGRVTASFPPGAIRIAPGESVVVPISVTSLDSFSGPVRLELGYSPLGFGVVLAPSTVVPPANGSASVNLTLTVPPTAQPLLDTIGLRVMTDGDPVPRQLASVQTQVLVLPHMTLSTTPVTITPGGDAMCSATVTSNGPFAGTVMLSPVGGPAYLAASPTSVSVPAYGSATSTLTLHATTAAPPGAAGLGLLAFANGLTPPATSTSIYVTVVPACEAAAFDPALQAPRCTTLGTCCDSGDALLLGRGEVSGGPEPNQPNTLYGSCADGDAGVFHVYESNDRLKVYALDGGPLAPGKTVRVEATVWPLVTLPTPDALDLYYAADALAPAWTHIATLTPTGAGAQEVLAADYVLPPGTLQAVRANFRQWGTPSPCSPGEYDDHDDLVFAVASDGTAVWDAALRVPACALPGRSCDSGPTLLNGRGTISGGHEPNQPNTIYGLCPDGWLGSYHVEESLDRLKVTTLDGSLLAGGRTVQIEATVWAFMDMPSDDALDLYYAADATLPAWTYLTTLVPSAGGAQTLSATYTLPAASGLQAVRGRFRYAGAAAACGSGDWDDHDDLAFFVQ